VTTAVLPTHPSLADGARRTLLTYLAISALVILLMMVAGLILRMGQAQWIQLPADIFYQIMTAHGIGMVGIAGLAASAVMWFFLSQHVRLSPAILVTNLIFFLLGVVLILGGIFLGGFAAAWTFLYPLPAQNMNQWGTGAAVSYMVGVLLVGVGFLLLYLDVGRAIISKYGSLGRGLGWPQLFSNSSEPPPPAAVVASTMVVIVNIVSILVGAVVLVLTLVNLLNPGFVLDALLVKNMIYVFGHIFINATIYQAIIVVYELLPRYTGRPWKVTKPFLAAWTVSTLLVISVYPHHLLMDFVMPDWVLLIGQIGSYLAGLPLLLATAYGAAVIVSRSGIRWDLVSGLCFLSVWGWAAGILPAIVDAVIPINSVMHNTLWVPGHFHFYTLLGLVAMLVAFMRHITQGAGNGESLLDKLAFWAFAVGGLGFVMIFLWGGLDSVPRRWAVHLPEWLGLNQAGSIFAAIVVLAMLVLLLRFFQQLKNVQIVHEES
jgi:cytochrome c oxidase subunit 1